MHSGSPYGAPQSTIVGPRGTRATRTMPRPDKRGALDCLARPRLFEIAAVFELDASGRLKKDEIIDVIARSHRASFEAVLDQLRREELKDICRAHGLADGGKEKTALRDHILMRDLQVDTTSEAAILEDGGLSRVTARPLTRSVLRWTTEHRPADSFATETHGSPTPRWRWARGGDRRRESPRVVDTAHYRHVENPRGGASDRQAHGG